MKRLLPLLVIPVLLSACTTIKSYEAKLDPGPAWPKDRLIQVYPEKIGVPRPYEIVGAMSITDTPFTVFGGSLESELKAMKKKARRVGADAVRLTSVEQPNFLHAKYRMKANLVRFLDEWESLPWSEEGFSALLKTNEAALDPIEGIWSVTDVTTTRVGIIRSKARPGRDFVVFVLTTENPVWKVGDKKMDLASGERAGVYRGIYIYDDYQRQPVAFSLRGDKTFSFRLTEDSAPLIFTKD